MTSFAFSCVVDDLSAQSAQTVVWVNCLKHLQSVNPNDIFVHLVDVDDIGFLDWLKTEQVNVVAVEPFDRRNPHCNRIQQLATFVAGNYDQIVFMDAETAWVGDAPLPIAASVAGRIADRANPPERILRAVFAAADLGKPKWRFTPGERDVTDQNNLDGGVCICNREFVADLAEAWRASAAWCLDRLPLFESFAIHADQVSFALAMRELHVNARLLPVTWNYPTYLPAAGLPDRSPEIIRYRELTRDLQLIPVGLPSVDSRIRQLNEQITRFLRQSPPSARLRDMVPRADNRRSSVAGPAKHGAAGPGISVSNRLKFGKVVVGSGWWCDQTPHDWALGARLTRTVDFFDLWYGQVVQCLDPDRIVVTDSASPIKPHRHQRDRVEWISLDRNYGHPNDIRIGRVTTKYSGFTRSVINGAMYALCCDADAFVYVEQDCLLRGEDFLDKAVDDVREDILLGLPTENGKGINGAIAAPMLQQSLMVVRRPALERFLISLLGAPWNDGDAAPEEIMKRTLAPYGFLRVPYGRSRPIDFDRPHFYAQHLDDDELRRFCRLIGVDPPADGSMSSPGQAGAGASQTEAKHAGFALNGGHAVGRIAGRRKDEEIAPRSQPSIGQADQQTPLVDVIVFTYNHVRFIRQALDSVLMQQTNFSFRIIILEDFSSDGTREIVQEYAAAHPDVIELRLHDRNLCSNVPVMDAMRDSEATYIAMLDGDDYWTDVNKLSRQAAFLQTNPDCALCYHNIEIVSDDNLRPSHLKYSAKQPPYATIHDLFVRCFMNTCAVMYRRSALAALPAWFGGVEAADWNLHLLAARTGRIGYISDPMAAYRVHAGGLWSGKGALEQWQHALDRLNEMFGHFEPRYHPDIRRGLVNVHEYYAHALAAAGNLAEALDHLETARVLAPPSEPPVVITQASVLELAVGAEVEAGSGPGLEASVRCDGARATSFIVVDGEALPTKFEPPSRLRAVVPDSVCDRPRSRLYVLDINGQSNAVDVTFPHPEQRLARSGVAVIIPCFNQGRFLADAIDSVLSQTRRPDEIIVVDDGSTDDTADVAARYPAVRCIRQSNQGVSAARNIGIAQSSSFYIVFLDADDRLLPGAVETGLAAFAAHPECGFVYGRFQRIDAEGGDLPTGQPPLVSSNHYEHFLRRNFISPASAMFRRDVVEDVGGFQSESAPAEDYDLYLRVTRNLPAFCHGQLITQRRIHDAQVTNNTALILKQVLKVLETQWPHVRDIPRLRDAYFAGKRHYQEWYGGKTAKHTQQRLVKLAYGMQVHEKPGQFRWVFDAIYNRSDTFSLHVDEKSPKSEYNGFRKIVENKPNLVELARKPIFWGGWSCAMQPFRAIEALLAFDSTWTHFLNISGSCFPLRSRTALVEFLCAHPESNFVQLAQKVEDAPMLLNRLRWSHNGSESGPVQTKKRKAPPDGFTVQYDGEAWFLLTRSFCEWITKDPLSQKIQNFFRDVAHPDEMIMQTLLLNSPFREKNIGQSLWEIVWQPDAFHPNILTMADRDRLMQSTAFFARKFDESVDPGILEFLAQQIRGTSPTDPALSPAS